MASNSADGVGRADGGRDPFREDLNHRRDHVVWTWRAIDETASDDDDAPAVEDDGVGRGGGVAMDGEAVEAVHGEAGSGVDEVTKGLVAGGETPVRRPTLSQTGEQAARRRGAARQEGIDDACCEFFVENAIPFNAAKSKSFKKFQLACYEPQPAASCPLVSTGYNPLRCRLLDRLCGRLEAEEKAVRDDWEVTGCTFITDGTTDIYGRSFMNYILAGRSKPVFIKCEDVSEGEKDAAAVVAGWKRFFREWGVDKVTAICTDSFAGNKSAARMLREDPEFAQIYWIPCTAHCMDLLMHDIGKKEWAATIIDKANKVVTFFRVHRWSGSQLRTQLLQCLDLECTCLLREAQTRFGTNYVMLQRLQVDKDVHCLSQIYDLARQLPVFVRSSPLDDKERDDILVDVKNRTDMLLSPIHAVAWLLDPVLRDIAVFGNVELMTQFEAVVEWLISKRGSKKFDDCLDQLYEFQMARGVFATTRAVQRAKKDNAVLWWEAHGAGHPEIKALAVKVLSIWTTSSPAERNWSTWSLVQTKSRNKLHHQRTKKLVYSHWSLRLKSRGDDGPTVVQQHEEQPVEEEEEDGEQQHEEQEAEQQHEEHQEKQQEVGQQAEVHEEQQIKVHEEQQIEEQQVEDHDEQHEMHPVEEYDDQQQADVQQWEDALGTGSRRARQTEEGGGSKEGGGTKEGGGLKEARETKKGKTKTKCNLFGEGAKEGGRAKEGGGT
ncbi:hypothetical protein CBR_g45823 [Chara braunii]|uniref:DUF659 domain-containing protein n=1 Tax=Chara braunii TaxID=69332 RepID=A0A388LZN1_CHABU|nr:hypothetical protein CBR_g45823 [Chara braunii]|eukprot:GBG87669.1 hypothetical protein CBR_g45823 [Chara braunii]